MGGFVEFSVYLSCLSFVLYFYSTFVLLVGVIGHLLLFLVTSCALFGIILKFRIPRPADATVHNIFGTDWDAYNNISENLKIKNDYSMKVVAHRACGLDAPENSLAALNKVIKAGITAVEFDVCVTADKIPVVFHDSSLKRMTNICKNIQEVTFDEISKLNISEKHPFGKNFENENIPTMEEYVMHCLNNNIRMFIDLKGNCKDLPNFINKLFKNHPKLYENAIVSSFNPMYIYQIRAKDAKIACSLAWRPYYYSHEEYNGRLGPSHARTTNLLLILYLRVLNYLHQWSLWTFGYYVLGISALLLHKDMVSRELIQYWKQRGVKVIAWSVNLPTEKQYFEKILEVTYMTDTIINS